MIETQWEKKLKIRTARSRNHEMDGENSPYEPTPYSVLERLAAGGFIRKNNTVIDYGCGKGRVGCFLAYQTGCRVTGIDHDGRLIEKALENRKSTAKGNRLEFIHTAAEKYEVPSDADTFYFFNPFSVELLQSIWKKISRSYYEYPREMLLFFYYPSDEYTAWLMTVPELEFYDEISCEDLFDGRDPRERILIFRAE